MPGLDLDYDDALHPTMVDLLEHHARRLGVPLAAVERIGQDLDALEAFVVAAEDGRAHEMVARLMGGAATAPDPDRPGPPAVVEDPGSAWSDLVERVR